MHPLQCSRCLARVQVQKNSWEHTAIQWTEEARTACDEINHYSTETGREGRPGTPRLQCATLTNQIAEAVRSGAFPIENEEPIPGPVLTDEDEDVDPPFVFERTS